MPNYDRIKLIVLDVDGTLTDGGIYYDSAGRESKRFDVKDGLALKAAAAAGLDIAIITGRHSPMVARRAEELDVKHLVEGAQQKFPALKELLGRLGLSCEEVCYIGDDWNDLQCMEAVGLSMCPADAVKEVCASANYVAVHAGGHGAVRECLEHLLKTRDQWETSCKTFYYR